jgi:hypothetical protein
MLSDTLPWRHRLREPKSTMGRKGNFLAKSDFAGIHMRHR